MQSATGWRNRPAEGQRPAGCYRPRSRRQDRTPAPLVHDVGGVFQDLPASPDASAGLDCPVQDTERVGLVVVSWSEATAAHGLDDVCFPALPFPQTLRFQVPTGTPWYGTPRSSHHAVSVARKPPNTCAASVPT